MRKLQKHHYIPEFYLKQWAGSDGRLCEYSQPHKSVKAQMKHPGGTGYVRGLYSIEGAPVDLADVFESKFLSIADGTAAVALRRMISDAVIPPPVEKAAWTRFILTLFYRTPEGVSRTRGLVQKFYEEQGFHELREAYESWRSPDDPETVEEYLALRGSSLMSRNSLLLMSTIMQSEKVGNRLMSMRWHLGRFTGLKNSLLTSDRPIVMTNGIGQDDSHLVMPLTPSHVLCIAGTDVEAQKIIARSQGGELARLMNDRIVRQARKYVFGRDDSQLRFVSNRLGEKAVCSPFE